MRSSSWTPVATAVDPSAVLTLVAVQLRLRAGADPGVFAPWIDRIRAELVHTPDLVGYGLRLTGGVLRVVSAWSRRASLTAFERGPLHTAAEQELAALLHPPAVAIWRAAGTDLPPVWDDVRLRLAAADRRTRKRLTDGQHPVP
ncbi:hypothetical protein ACI8AA_22125 [Geodermatophilus sp. SYSU D01180]